MLTLLNDIFHLLNSLEKNDVDGEILLLHANKNNVCPFIIPFYMTLSQLVSKTKVITRTKLMLKCDTFLKVPWMLLA